MIVGTVEGVADSGVPGRVLCKVSLAKLDKSRSCAK